MSGDRTGDVSELLSAVETGTPEALNRAFALVYDELRALAERSFRAERPDHTLQATALVHELYLRLSVLPSLSWENRRHFFGIAARAMRQILVEHARGRGTIKRNAGQLVTLQDELVGTSYAADDDLVSLDEALQRLDALAPRAARVVELRYFAGLSIEQTAETLEVSVATVKRDWLTARAWLQRDLS